MSGHEPKPSRLRSNNTGINFSRSSSRFPFLSRLGASSWFVIRAAIAGYLSRSLVPKVGDSYLLNLFDLSLDTLYRKMLLEI